jgi:hypothetical protein
MERMKTIPAIPGWSWKHLICTTKRIPFTDIRPDYMRVKRGLRALRAYFRKKRFMNKISAVGGIEFGPKNAMCHVHIIIFAPYLDFEEIGQIWGQGSIQIKNVTSARQVENATLYAVDFTESKDPVFIANMGLAMKGTRRVFTWGKLYGCASRKKEKHEAQKCPSCDSLLRWEYVPEQTHALPPAGTSPGEWN